MMRNSHCWAHVIFFAALACATATASDSHHDLNVGGIKRQYLVHLAPGTSKGHPLPLLLVLHGGGGEPEGAARLTHMNDLADREGFLVVYPAGLRRHWNDGRTEIGANAEDVGFISAVIDDVARQYEVDRERIFATGISNGAFMSSRLACELSDRIRGVALVAGTISDALKATCRPKRPVAVLMFSGTEDPLVPYNGGNVGGGRGSVLGAEATAAFWARTNGCRTDSEHGELPARDVADPTRVSFETFLACPRGGEVKLYTIRGGGHTWPGGRPYLPAFFVGKVSHQIDAGEIMWNFFRQQSGATKRP